MTSTPSFRRFHTSISDFRLKGLFHWKVKKIEKERGIARSCAIDVILGDDAISLWQNYKVTGDGECLNFLVEYNTEDAVDLNPLAESVSAEMRKRFVDVFMDVRL